LPSTNYTLALHDALPISTIFRSHRYFPQVNPTGDPKHDSNCRNRLYLTFSNISFGNENQDLMDTYSIKSLSDRSVFRIYQSPERSEEQTSELQSRENIVC